MAAIHLLYARDYKINDEISVKIPTVGEVLANEDGYYEMVSLITAMPIDMMAQLEDIGVDFEQINAYQLFLIIFQVLCTMDTSLIFGDLDLTKYKIVVSPDTGDMVLRNQETGGLIDSKTHAQIATVLRTLHHLEKNTKRPANKEARDYLMRKARKKMKRRRKSDSSALEQEIIALVNTEQFSYKFEEVPYMTIYQFNESLRQIVRKIEFDNKMHGIYAGTIDAKKVSSEELNWLTHK